jgi:hypothetical protein
MDKIMKKIFIFAILAMAAAAVSCNEKVEYDLPHGDEYDHLYIVQASAGATQEVNLLSSQESWSTQVSAFYSALSAPSDIKITFEVDNSLIEKYNEEHSTAYIPLPEGSYKVGTPSVTIKAGQYRTPLIPLEVSVAALEPELENPYLLPLTMKVANKDIVVNEDLRTVFYMIKVNKDRTPVILNGKVEACNEFFSFHDLYILTRNRTTGALNRYDYDPETNTLAGPTNLYNDWTSSNVVWLQAGNGYTLQCVNSAMTWYAMSCGEDGQSIPIWQTTSAVITGGCGIFMDNMICEAPGDGYLSIWGGSGNVAFYGMTDNGLGLNGIIAHTNPGDGSNIATDYTVRFLYKHDLFCIDFEGNLWKYPWNSSSHALGARSQVGSGWGKFVGVTSYGDDFLMLLPDGTVKKIEWDPTVFWAFTD